MKRFHAKIICEPWDVHWKIVHVDQGNRARFSGAEYKSRKAAAAACKMMDAPGDGCKYFATKVETVATLDGEPIRQGR